MNRAETEAHLDRVSAACRVLDGILDDLREKLDNLRVTESMLEDQPLRLVYGFHHQVDAEINELVSVRIPPVAAAREAMRAEEEELREKLREQ